MQFLCTRTRYPHSAGEPRRSCCTDAQEEKEATPAIAGVQVRGDRRRLSELTLIHEESSAVRFRLPIPPRSGVLVSLEFKRRKQAHETPFKQRRYPPL